MRYVIVSVVKGEAGKFNDELRKKIFEKFNVKASKLPPHFTIKAPFEYDGNINDLEEIIENTASNVKASDYKIVGYNHFDNRVVYMNVSMSEEGKIFHDKLIDNISKLPYINFSKSDGKDKVFHVTLASKKISNIYDDIWSYVDKYKCDFNSNFDNVCIFKWENNTWILYKDFQLEK